jgi:trehalose-6-phosphate synthase
LSCWGLRAVSSRSRFFKTVPPGRVDFTAAGRRLEPSVPKGDGANRAGGLEVALRPALERNGGVWFGWSGKAVPRPDVEML